MKSIIPFRRASTAPSDHYHRLEGKEIPAWALLLALTALAVMAIPMAVREWIES